MLDGLWLPQGSLTMRSRTTRSSGELSLRQRLSLRPRSSAWAAVAWKFRARAWLQAEDGDQDLMRGRNLFGRWRRQLLFLGLLLMGTRSWAGSAVYRGSCGAEPIEVFGRQFAWSFRYPGADGRFGRTNLRSVNDVCE